MKNENEGEALHHVKYVALEASCLNLTKEYKESKATESNNKKEMLDGLKFIGISNHDIIPDSCGIF
jgi:hypothetical protein